MHDYLLSAEWVRFAFVFGIAVSMLLYERRHLTTGSIVVPGYIAVFMMHPLVLIATFLNAFATYALVNKVLRKYVLLYGRTKFTVLAVTSTLIQTAMLRTSPSGAWLWERDVPLFVGVGYIVPALIAHDMARQGIGRTIKSVLLAGGIVALPIAIALAIDLPGVNDLAPIGGFGTLAYPVQWLPIAIIVSIVASWAVATNYRCRSGGFIGAAFMGMFMADPWQVGAALAIAAASYLVVTKLLMHRMILFGRRKFSAMLVTSSALAWPALWFGDRFLSVSLTHHLAVGSLALTPLLLPGLVANDIQRTSPARVAFGLSLAALCSVTVTWWVGATITRQSLHPGWKLVATMTIVTLGWPQVRRATERAVRTVQVKWTLPLPRAAAAVASVTAVTRPTVGQARSRVQASLLTAITSGRVMALRLRRSAIEAAVGVVGSSQPVTVVSVGIGDGPVTWNEWARQHPAVAADAEAWLDKEIARGRRVDTDAQRAPAAAPAEFDQRAVEILAQSLQGRGVDGFAPVAAWPEMPSERPHVATAATLVPPASFDRPRVAPANLTPTHAPVVPRSSGDDEAIRQRVRTLVETEPA